MFYLDDVLLPVAPDKMQMKIKNQNKTVQLINEGEINLLKLPGLSEISFECLLPSVEYPFAMYPNGFKDSAYYLGLFEKLKTSPKPFKFYVLRNNKSETAISVSLEDYTITEDAKNGTDFTVSVKLKQYKTFGTKVVTFKKENGKTKATTGNNRDDNKKKPKTYTVKKGDNLWAIAKTQLGKGGRSGEIYKLNKSTIEASAKKNGRSSSSNGKWIYVGTVLSLP